MHPDYHEHTLEYLKNLCKAYDIAKRISSMTITAATNELISFITTAARWNSCRAADASSQHSDCTRKHLRDFVLSKNGG